jgi:hypothetical protein
MALLGGSRDFASASRRSGIVSPDMGCPVGVTGEKTSIQSSASASATAMSSIARTAPIAMQAPSFSKTEVRSLRPYPSPESLPIAGSNPHAITKRLTYKSIFAVRQAFDGLLPESRADYAKIRTLRKSKQRQRGDGKASMRHGMDALSIDTIALEIDCQR